MEKLRPGAAMAFSGAPLRLATGLGLIVSTLSFGYAVYGALAQGQIWPTAMVAVTFLGGVQLISLGIVGEYVGRIYDEVKRRPLYVAHVERPGEAASAAAEQKPRLAAVDPIEDESISTSAP